MNNPDPFGVNRNTVGLIEYRGACNILEARLLLASLVRLTIKPAFGNVAIITLGKTERCPYEYEHRIENGWTRIALNIYQETVGIHQEVRFVDVNDEVPINIQLGEIDKSICLDGYGLQIDIERMDVSLHITASNPRNRSINELANNVIGLARKYMIESASIRCLSELGSYLS